MSATPSVLLCLAHGNDAIEITTFLSLLPRAGIHITVASVEGDSALTLRSAEGLTFQADVPLCQAVDTAHDLLLLIGGKESCETYAGSDLVIESIAQFTASQGYVAAMSHVVPGLIDKVDRYRGANVTCLPQQSALLQHTQWQERRVVVDPRYHLLSGQGPLCATDMSLKIIELLKGKEDAHAITHDLALPIGIYNYQE
ncbi:4-methyl-5(b-hydroxyethyl)-thiazole monophosphate biosynthesis [Rosenbergiella nectarea]|uniref:4-methyl-5(B-hydroxyethyl)-thiazole monophosphate biosynthesis n=1 Tax=Rosenbergiella nectarea TaxID=988801 RepID=A0A1H9IJT7_9GAMM|nr:DJ-1/PfpI family protein [Rosenbergiella nectarea]SEQ74655.1 4-methyl-5(b-hydroxyethyl)-thiazole monophosphate biosynthesis [Rosenbergiella nectarea]